MTSSAIYEGHVYHERLAPRRHAFRYRIFLMYVDLDELPRLFRGRWLWSSQRPNLAWVRRADSMGPRERPLKEVVLDRVEQQLGVRPTGAVRMLTQPRTYGYVFNPVTFYYCHDAHERLVAIAAEITNTPWNERHTYVLDARTSMRVRFRKDFHVSPFFGMDHDYDWRFTAPGAALEIHMSNLARDGAVFHAGLIARRRELSAASLAGVLLRYPLSSLRLHAAIYWQAALLYAKRAPFHPHPRKLGDAARARIR